MIQEEQQKFKPVSRRLATIVNLIHQYISIGLAIVNGIVLVPMYLKYIDRTLYGAWLATGSVIAWLMLADAGLADIVRQQTAKVYGAKDFNHMGKIIGTGTVCILAIGFLPSLLSFGIAPFLPQLFGLKDIAASSLSKSFILAGFVGSLVIIAGGAAAVQQGLQRNITYSIIYTIGALTGIGVTISMLTHGYGLISIPGGLVVRGIVWSVLGWADIFYYCMLRLHIRFALAKETLKDVASLTSWTFFNRLFYQLFAKSDAFVIGILIGPTVTIIYTLTRSSWDILALILERVCVAFLPGLAHLHGEDDPEKFRHISQRLLRIVMYTLAIAAGVCIGLNKSFVSLWVGSDLYAGVTFDLLMVGASVVIIFATVVHHVLFASGNIKRLSVIGVVLSSTRAVILVGLVWLLKILGSPASLLLGYGIACVMYFGPLWISQLQILKKDFRTELISLVKPFLIAIILALIMRQYITADTWLRLVAYGTVYVLVAGGIMVAMEKNLQVEVRNFLLTSRSKRRF